MKLRRYALASVAGMVVLVVWGIAFWGPLAGPLSVFQEFPMPAA